MIFTKQEFSVGIKKMGKTSLDSFTSGLRQLLSGAEKVHQRAGKHLADRNEFDENLFLQTFLKASEGDFYSSGYYNWSLDCEALLCSCLAMFNFNLGIEEFQYSSKSCLFVWSPTSQGQILPRPLQTGPTCFWKGFLQTRHNFKPQQFQTQFDHLSIWSSRKWWDAFERVKTRTLRCALGFLKKTSKYLRSLSSFDMKMIRKSIIRIPNGSIIHNEGRNPLWR